ncbi:unnamed protein product [Caenorhabditis sp. 36 PRJEB53466]|nr:unnamed protein product [Caenorhabditis sp. 36 PRJEB53466]
MSSSNSSIDYSQEDKYCRLLVPGNNFSRVPEPPDTLSLGGIAVGNATIVGGALSFYLYSVVFLCLVKCFGPEERSRKYLIGHLVGAFLAAFSTSLLIDLAIFDDSNFFLFMTFAFFTVQMAVYCRIIARKTKLRVPHDIILIPSCKGCCQWMANMFSIFVIQTLILFFIPKPPAVVCNYSFLLKFLLFALLSTAFFFSGFFWFADFWDVLWAERLEEIKEQKSMIRNPKVLIKRNGAWVIVDRQIEMYEERHREKY